MTINLREQGRVCYLSSVDISMPDGPGVNEREFAESIVRALGDRVRIVIPEPRHHLPETESHCFVTCSPRSSFGTLSPLIAQFDLTRVARRLICREPVNLLVVRLHALPLAIRDLAVTRRIPLAVKTLGDPTVFRRRRGAAGLMARLFARWHERVTRQVVSAAIAIDACTNELIELNRRVFSLGDDAFQLVPNATNTRRFYPLDQEEARASLGLQQLDPILGFVGGQPASRGGRQIIELASRLIHDYPRLGVVIVGAPLADLTELAQKTRLGDRCVFPGSVPYVDVPQYVNAFSVGFAFDEAERIEMVGNSYQKIRQYVACGVPTITAGRGSEFLVSARLGSVVSVGDMEALEKETRNWLALAGFERDQFRCMAATYAQTHLSTDQALRMRLDWWSRRLASVNESSCPDPVQALVN